MKTASKLAILFAILTFSAAAANRWNTGQVLNFGPATTVTGPAFPDAAMTSHAPAVVFIPNTVAWDAVVIRSKGETYLCRERRQFDKKPAALSLGESVQFYLHGRQLVFRDDSGKRHTAFLVSQSL